MPELVFSKTYPNIQVNNLVFGRNKKMSQILNMATNDKYDITDLSSVKLCDIITLLWQT